MNTIKLYSSSEHSGLNALLFTPLSDPNNSSGELPLLVYLHGAGERGIIHDHLLRHGVPRLIKEGLELDAIVLAPQCPEWAVWDNVVSDVKHLIDDIVIGFGIKRDRITLTGSSMGGYGTFSLALAFPTLFAGIAPVAGGGMAWRAKRLTGLQVLAYHGEADPTVLPICSSMMTDAINAAGGKAELNILPGLGHNDGIDFAYRRTELIERLLQLRKTDFSRVYEPYEEYFN